MNYVLCIKRVIKKGIVVIPLFILLNSLFTRETLAHCPLCVAGAAAGVTLTRWVGVDDSITGVWIGALLGSASFWTYSAVLRRLPLLSSFRRNRVLKYTENVLKPIIYLLVFALTIWSFYKFQLVIRMSQIMGLDKLTFGILTGGVVFYLVDIANKYLVKKDGRVFFPYQRMALSLGSVVFLSVSIYILINYYI
ncbi:hypothetical protein A2955_03550 [Candidatus Woesebacteria bacterium RIFCSPLOWO2_01_FULL_37_19]|uniref:Uncharacterized protein n=2 Tax=Candidatus Woeseibacteriota TaxID=1752722 RepID=A0A1F8B788_9BACT|nr:MAG: hypothetical protein A2771_02545 [Candidatus Woesebacteria bacterium RIFCSPHIGHO2_01_FULL_38_26b]OGM59800.1 MAG: hypothetical protein A2955_03550 [Candidatus Woesebacteria bacterium RIFCSPLOWO2_01_FULL_37_19]